MPARSKGCAKCVSRKVRCDGRRPTCKRCEVHKVECPGYRSDVPDKFVFQDITSKTATEANKDYARTEHKQSVKRINRHAGSFLQNVSPADGVELAAHAHRSALYNELLQSYLPRKDSTISPSSPTPLSFLEILGFRAPSLRASALESALDALSLVQLGSIAKDQRLLNFSVALYGKALSRLALDIQREDLQHSDGVLASATILSTCELYQEIAQNNGGWMKHIDGTNQLMKIRGPQNLDSDLSLALYANARNNALVQGLLSRKASYMAAAQWRNVKTIRTPLSDATSTGFYDAAMQLSGLLERADALCANASAASEAIDRLLEDLSALEYSLKSWFTDWECSYIAQDQQPRVLRPIAHFVTFSTRCPDRTLSRAYYFPTFHTGYIHSLYWMCMHSLRTCINDISKLWRRHHPDPMLDPRYEVTEEEQFNYMMDLCRCIPFFCKPLSGSVGHIAIFLPMRFTAMFFGPRGQWQWLKWIGAVKATVFTQGLEPPNVGGGPLFPQKAPGGQVVLKGMSSPQASRAVVQPAR